MNRISSMNGNPIPALNAPAPSMSHVTAWNSQRVRTQHLHDNCEKLELATLDPPPQPGADTQAILGAADVLPPPTDIRAPDSSSFENDLSYEVGSRKAQSTLNLAYPSHLDAENSSSTTAVQALCNSTGSPSVRQPLSFKDTVLTGRPDYQTKATSFDAQTRLPPISAWYKPCLAAPLHQEYVYPSLTSSRASGKFSTGLSSDMSHGAGSSSHPGTPQSRKPAKLTVPPEISILPERNSQITSWSSKEYSPSASGNTQFSGSVISSTSVTSGFKRRSHSPNDSEDPGPSKRHRKTQYSRTQGDAPSATSSGSLGLAGEQNQIIARQIPTTTTSSQISGDSGKVPSNNRRTALKLALWLTAELIVANKHIFTLDGSSSNPTNVSPQHAQVEQNICTQSDEPPKCLKWLEEYIMKGAELDSFERDPPPRCHPDTRTTLIQQAQDWFTQPPEGKRVLWLRGPAGVGKSAIIQTLAEGWREEQKLGASLFFSRERRHTDPRQVFPSLAYKIATRDASYAAYISDVMIRDPRSLAKAMNEQFRVLFIEPFSRRQIKEGSEKWVITIDGLDECGDDQQTGRHSTSIHREIVQLVSNSVAQNPSVPLLWIIASRPEAHLKAVFDEEAIQNCFFDVEVPVDSDEAQRDVEKYLVSEFKKIREQYPDLIHETAWPIYRQFVKIVEASRGYFAFAAVLVRFIEDPNVANPIDQLKWVMRAITRILLSRKQIRNPLAVLDELYTEILEGIKPEVFQVTRQILGASMFLDQKACIVLIGASL
ncbi:hypothetical protein AN958_02770 [Leucoagaricus sp. SymC.cos]|nr:hypothetical protein AN958_02770 [Leucoagaricus sp. SymC.cos]